MGQALHASDIADAILYIVTRPLHVAINEILERATRSTGAASDGEEIPPALGEQRALSPLVEGMTYTAAPPGLGLSTRSAPLVHRRPPSRQADEADAARSEPADQAFHADQPAGPVLRVGSSSAATWLA